MKKLLVLILSLSFATSLCACELAEDIKYGRGDGMYSSQSDNGNSAADDLKDGASSLMDDASSILDGASN